MSEKNNPAQAVSQQGEQSIRLTFKASPLFTAERQRRITDAINTYCHYLSLIGFDPPKEFPPVGTRPGTVSTRSGIYPGTIYSEDIMLPDAYLDDPQRVRDIFSSYIFEKLLRPNPLADPNGFGFQSAIVFSNYYLADFGSIPPPAPRKGAPADKWVSAIWDIREKHGREFANKSLFYAFKQWRIPGENTANEDFDAYFGLRFTIGVNVEDNMFQNAKSITQILRARGIQYGSGKHSASIQDKSPTLLDLFRRDFPTVPSMSDAGLDLRSSDGETIHVDRRVFLDFKERTKFIAIYVPTSKNAFGVCMALADKIKTMLLKGGTTAIGGDTGEMTKSEDLTFSGRVFIYHEWPLSNKEKADIVEAYSAQGLDVQFRGIDYIASHSHGK